MFLDFPLKKEQFKKDKNSINEFGKDWSHYTNVQAKGVVFPYSHKEVVEIVLWAKKHKLSLVPSGGRTGLSGGSCALNNELIISFSKMDQILEWDEISQTVTCQAGVITKKLQEFVDEKAYLFPIDFASTSSSQVGGNIATNAGGIKVIRYGMTRQWIAGMKVVLCSGKTLNLNKNLIKNATGFDLKQLFIGTEGTLGLITECSFFVTGKNSETSTYLLSLPDYQSVFETYKLFKKNVKLYSFEMFNEISCSYLENHFNKKLPIKKAPLMIIFQVEKSKEKESFKLFEEALAQKWIFDGVMSQSTQHEKELWFFREQISEALSKFKPYKNDISLRPSSITVFLEEIKKEFNQMMPESSLSYFGHIGDGNLHLNIIPSSKMTREDFLEKCHQWNEFLFQKISDLGGSISAEHGIGLLKKDYLHFSKTKEELELMKEIKKILDPENRMNPGKIF